MGDTTLPQLPTTIEDAAQLLREGRTSSVELVRTALGRADALDGTLGCYLARFDESALAAAERADRDLAAGLDRGLLHGIPVGVKDMLTTSECPTTGQSLVLADGWGPQADATAVAGLRAAGAIVMGKLTLSELAIGRPDDTKPFPVPRNPWDLRRWPGGSSSGSGNGVAAGLVLGAVGTDTGGSVRMPAAFCGISGLKPTHGRVPTDGCIPLAATLDTVGPMARSARSCAALFAAMIDPADRAAGADASSAVPSLAGLRVGVAHLARTLDDTDPAALAALDRAVDVLRHQGARVVPVELPLYDEMRTAMMVSLSAEAFAYHRSRMQARWGDFYAATRQYVAMGALASGADYVQAQRVRRAAQADLASLFHDVDLVVTPTATKAAPLYGEGWNIDVAGLLAHLHTGYWNSVGNPALAVPIGFNADGLPLSMQLAARPYDEATALLAGTSYQEATDWHLALPMIDAAAPAPPRAPAPIASGPPSAGSPPDASGAAVAAMFAAAGLNPRPAELDAFVGAFAWQRSGIDALYRALDDPDEPPALAFHPDP